MKKSFFWRVAAVLLAVVGLGMSARAAETPMYGESHFEQSYNYSAYSLGQGRFHVKVLVFAEGWSDNYWAHRGGWWFYDDPDYYPKVRYEPMGGSKQTIIEYEADGEKNKPGHVDGRPRTKGWATLKVHSGTVVVTNTYTGNHVTLAADGQFHDVDLMRGDVGDHLTYLEFDWYPPATLTGNFSMDVYSSRITLGMYSPDWEDDEFELGVFQGVEMDQQPELMEPIFYPSDEVEAGSIAVPYISYQETFQYSTSVEPDLYIPLHDRSGLIYVPAKDTVQHGFYVNMETRTSQSSDDADFKQWLKSSMVNIPAYHKIYNMTASPYIYQDTSSGKWLCDMRAREIEWKVRFPYEEDLVSYDYFELQRAYRPDFSDAVTIELINMDEPERDSVEWKSYRYVDSVRGAWVNPTYPAGSDSSYMVFYRVRRSSASVWGWDANPYAAAAKSQQQVYLQGVGGTGSWRRYTTDPGFATNHKVKLSFQLATANENMGYGTEDAPRILRNFWDDRAQLKVQRIAIETRDTVTLTIHSDSIKAVLDRINKSESGLHSAYPLTYKDQLYLHCVHYRYRVWIDTVGATLKLNPELDNTPTSAADAWVINRYGGEDPYFVDAAELMSLNATQGEYPDYVLLTWDATEGATDQYIIETRPSSDSSWRVLDTTVNNYWRDSTANPAVTSMWQYRVTAQYMCNGMLHTDSRTTEGYRSQWGRVSGRVHYEDGTGCAGITVVATRSSDGATVQTVLTDDAGNYMLDSLLYADGVEYIITPTDEHAEFRYNHTSSGSATANLSLSHCVVTGIDFANISSVRFSGRVLYENSSVPVRDANLLLNGKMVSLQQMPVKTDVSGDFEIRVPQGEAFTIQVVKEGHRFAGDGFVRINNDSLLTLTEPLDGVRVWDQTKVTLMGRLCGGLDQRDLPLGFGLSRNNLGDDLKLVLELEGDNISYIVRVPSDLTKDTLEFLEPHLVYREEGVDTVGWTKVHYQQRRIVIEPDSVTGEFRAELFPVRYKVTQATARGYATLFPAGTSMDVIDLANAAGFGAVNEEGETENGLGITQYDRQYKVTYRSPISITCKQMRWGMEVDWMGEETLQRTSITNQEVMIPLATKLDDGTYHYTFGLPVFKSGNYDFKVYAHEDYYYNNDVTSTRHDQVPIRGGMLKIYNGMSDPNDRSEINDVPLPIQIVTKELGAVGTAEFSVPIDYPSFVLTDSLAVRTIDLSVESEGQYVVSQAVRGYVTGNRNPGAVVTTGGSIQLLDILRDPPGTSSYAYLEDGTSYKFSYVYDSKFKFGLDISLTLGQQSNFMLGAYQGNQASGMISGDIQNISTAETNSIPIVCSYKYKQQGSYSFTTSQRITTSSSPFSVGQIGDVYIGLVQNIYSRRWDAVAPVDSVTYAAMSASSANGSMPTVATGADADGHPYYLVIGSELESGPYVDATFAYTHDYIKNNIIPQLLIERDALLLTCDSATAQAAANNGGNVVYWSRVAPGDSNWACTDYYCPLKPEGYTADWSDQVEHYNNLVADWSLLLYRNESEKVLATTSPLSEEIANYSIGTASELEHNEEYAYSNAVSSAFFYPGGTAEISGLVSTYTSLFGKAIGDLLKSAFETGRRTGASSKAGRPRRVIVNAAHSANELEFTPILDLEFDRDPTADTTWTRKIGFKLAPDELSHIDVGVYRVKMEKGDYWFNDSSAAVREYVDNGHDYDGESMLYGAPVYFLRGGATKCPCEVADSTEFYFPKMPLSAGSLKLDNPKIDINVHERSDVPVDRPAVFTITLYNDIEEPVGEAASSLIPFTLMLGDVSNPHGARILIDGMPLTDGRTVMLHGRQVITKTVEVYAGDGYDYENLELVFQSSCYYPDACRVAFSVHYTPVSSPVTLREPHQNWVLNTLSPQDSIGYYLPVTISDYDVNYREFDHIELQYKVSTQSNDSWVKLCSWYADSALYREATGTKAMISGGHIDNIRFYGDRDPVEQYYDLRAVSFCRHGSGFVTRSSEVMSGVKDTRRPRVFGQPMPANGILGVGDNLMLRFNEPIAGNLLDEDNNFQLLGGTNSTGITSSTSVFFDGSPSCGATTAVTRALNDKSFSVDLMVKPSPTTSPNSQELFGHNTTTGGISFGLIPDSNSFRLYAYIDDYSVQSLRLEPMTDFTRVIMTYDDSTGRIRFYAGTQDVTDPDADTTGADGFRGEAPLVFGHGYKGNMLEARLWFKVLSQAEIVETNRKRLTGYERKLAAYYPMNEGRGETLQDKANGGTLTLYGSSWTTPSGYSLHLNGSTVLKLDQNILSRSNIQDYSLMFWFRTNEYYAGLFSAGWDGTNGTLIALENGQLVFKNGNNSQLSVFNSQLNYADGAWHHYVITVNRTYNNACIYVDGGLVNTFSVDSLSGLSGEMYLGGANAQSNVNAFIGHLDGVALFEQSLPRALVESFDNLAPMGDEMGLIAYLPFNEQRENENGIMEEVFSVNNQRIVKENGQVVPTEQKLVLWPSEDTLASMADGSVRAPIRERDLVSKMNFDWAFNNDELLINLNMADNEINKNTLFITVRNVEDLNGNRTVSPTMWQVFVNKNTLLWDDDGIYDVIYYEYEDEIHTVDARIRNNSGRRHQFTIEGLPDWLTVDRPYGSIDPQESLTLTFSVDGRTLAVGTYSEIIYLIDEDGLSEPLKVRIDVKALCPWYGVEGGEYDRQMTLCGQVKIDGLYVTDPEDVVVAMAGDSVVGYAHVSPELSGGGSYVFMTIYGTQSTEGRQLRFRAWQAKTGHAYNLSSDEEVYFHSDAIVGLPPEEPVLLYSNSSAVQYFNLQSGWNWISFYIAPEDQGALVMNGHFDEDDQIKEANSRRFIEWDGQRWRGTLTNVDYHRVYMVYCHSPHYGVQVAGQRLTTDQQRTVTLKQGWNSLPYLQMAPASVTDALADYIEHVSVGDLVKSQDAFAYFSANQRWVGSLTAMRPGEGYFLKRLGDGEVSFTYHGTRNNKKGESHLSPFTSHLSPSLSTMTMIAATEVPVERVLVYVNGKQVTAAEPIDSLYFITIPADEAGVVTFALETSTSEILNSQISIPNSPDAHYGTLEQPVLLTLNSQLSTLNSVSAYPTVFTDQVTFFVNEELRMKNEEFSVTLTDALGRQVLHQEGILNSQFSILNLDDLPSGVYFATVNYNDNITTIKLIKK